MLYKSEMISPPAASVSVTPTNPRKEVSPEERRQRWFEVCLVLLVACGGYVLYSLYLLIGGPSVAPKISSFTWAGSIVQETSALLLLGYVLSRRGLGFANLGLRWSRRDFAVGLLVTVVSLAAYNLGLMLVQDIHHAVYGTWATGPTSKDFFSQPSVLVIPFSLLNPFFEELIVRAYLMTEVVELTGSPALAVALSVGVQFSYHLYYGWTGAISLSFSFLVSAVYYARACRALPIIIAHGFFDVYGLLRLW